MELKWKREGQGLWRRGGFRAGGAGARYQAGLYLLLAPYLVGALLLVALPALLSFVLALTEYDAISPPVWRGLDNFQKLSQDYLFFISVRNSALFALITVPLRLLGALGLAMLLRQPRRGVKFYRTAVYLPTIVPNVAYALIWLWLFNPLYGPLNLLLGRLGLPAPAWLVDEQTALPALALMALFQLGEGFAVLLAGLQEIPRDYYQAAALDGAGRWGQFRYITLPLLAPWLLKQQKAGQPEGGERHHPQQDGKEDQPGADRGRQLGYGKAGPGGDDDRNRDRQQGDQQ